VLGEESLRVVTEKGDKEFEFDRVFGTKDGQEEVRLSPARAVTERCCIIYNGLATYT
jgi:hypothetical protein